MWPFEGSTWVGGSEHLCRPNDGSRPTQGRLADDPRVEAVLQGLILFVPTAWLLICGPFRIAQLRGAKLVILPNNQLYLKIPATTTVFLLQLVCLVSKILDDSKWNLWASQLLLLIADALVCVLSFLEHGRNTGPSTLLVIYLAGTIFGGLITASLKYVAWDLCNISTVTVAIFVTRSVLLGLEGQTKRTLLRAPYNELPPEETSGALGVIFFWWVNKFLRNGYFKTLSLADMPPLDKSLDVMEARAGMQQAWDERRKPEGRFSLMWSLFWFSWRRNMSIIIPRFLLIVLRCCQPLLISRAINFVSLDLSPVENRNEAFRLILFTFVIYTGMALCNGINERLLTRINYSARMGLIGIIYNDCLTVKHDTFDESAALTLMSSDADDAASCASLFHETWSQVLELSIGMYLLAEELGWVCIIPPLVILGVSRIVALVTQNVVYRQIAFSKATQARISAIKSVLDSMKNIKMMGLVDKMKERIQATRTYEMKQYVAFYRLLVTFFISAVGLNLFSPAITLIFYAIQAQIRGAKSFDVQMAFTSLAIIGIICTPANALLGVLPEAASILAAFDRIQTFLLIPSQEDKRAFYKKFVGGELSAPEVAAPLGLPDRSVVNFDHVTIRPAPTAEPALKDIRTSWSKGDLVAINGAVGTGKTTFVKTLLGDLPQDTGVIETAYRSVAYCSHVAWLKNGTIKEVICGPLGDRDIVDEVWYNKVICVCDLEEDLAQMPNGDQTVIGSRGITLSGGQKQRIALARAVFAREEMVILDDVLSALDASTERHIVDKLMGAKGLFKQLGTTVVLITHATQYLSLADHIIVLDDKGNIAEQGTWNSLRSGTGQTAQLGIGYQGEGDDNEIRSRTEPNDETQDGPEPPDSNMQDMTRKTGDITLYKYYFNAIGVPRLFLLVGSLAIYAALVGLIPYWLKWMAESEGRHMWFYTGIYFLLAVGAFSSVAAAVGTIFLAIAPHSGMTLHDRLLSTVMHAPQSYFAKTDTGVTLNRFSSDMTMIDRSLPFALFQVFQAVFLLLSQCVLLGIVQPFIIVTLPFTILVVYFIQKFYLATSRQLRFIDLEARALVNTSFLETLEGSSTIRAFGWRHAFVKENARKLDMSLRPEYMLMCIQRWLDMVLDLIVPGLAIGVIGLAVELKGTTTGGQIGIALNVILHVNEYILRLVSSWTRLETSLGAISRLRAFEKDVQPEDTPGQKQWPPPAWPTTGAVEFARLSASYKTPVLALDNINVAIAPGAKVGVVGRTGSGKSSLLLTLLRLVELQGPGTVLIDGLDICNLPRDGVRSRIITVPQDPMLVKTDTLRQNLDIAGANVTDNDMVRALERVGLWKILQARRMEMGDSSDGSSDDSLSVVSDDAAQDNVQQTEHTGVDGMDDSSHASTNAPAGSVLDSTMKSLPLSQGQEQLFSLARALIMRPLRGRLVLLDEATSSVDGETDKLMQAIIREDFKDHTVVTVAHRLDTIMDSDVVLVLQAGKLVEAGPPSELAATEGGTFKALLSEKK